MSDTDDRWLEKVEGLRKRTPAEAFITLHDDGLREEAAKARVNLAQARLAARMSAPDADEAEIEQHPAVRAAQVDVDEAESASVDAEVTFHFRALPPDVYDALLLEHAPDDEQADARIGFNPATYIPALIAACSVRPLTADVVSSLMQPDKDGRTALNQGDVSVMFAACREINERPRMTLGKGSRPTAD